AIWRQRRTPRSLEHRKWSLGYSIADSSSAKTASRIDAVSCCDSVKRAGAISSWPRPDTSTPCTVSSSITSVTNSLMISPRRSSPSCALSIRSASSGRSDPRRSVRILHQLEAEDPECVMRAQPMRDRQAIEAHDHRIGDSGARPREHAGFGTNAFAPTGLVDEQQAVLVMIVRERVEPGGRRDQAEILVQTQPL